MQRAIRTLLTLTLGLCSVPCMAQTVSLDYDFEDVWLIADTSHPVFGLR